MKQKLILRLDQNDVQYNLQSIQQIKFIALQKVVLYNSYYLINAANNKFNYNNTIYEIPYGNYSGQQLATQLSTVTNLTATYNSNNYKFSITFNSSITWNFSLNNKSLNHILGFNNVDKINSSVVSDNIANLSLTPYYLLYIPELQNNDIQTINNAYEVIYNNVSSGDLLYFEKDIRDIESYEYDHYNNFGLYTLNISIKDQWGNVPSFNNQPIVLEFVVWK